MARKLLIWLAGGILVIGLVLVVGAFWMIGPRNLWGMWRYDQRRDGDLRVGQTFPDVPLLALDGETTVRLKDQLAGRPLVLVFGSYT